jgi:hypothetical protein
MKREVAILLIDKSLYKAHKGFEAITEAIL